MPAVLVGGGVEDKLAGGRSRFVFLHMSLNVGVTLVGDYKVMRTSSTNAMG